MKRLTAILLVILLLAGLSGCTAKEEKWDGEKLEAILDQMLEAKDKSSTANNLKIAGSLVMWARKTELTPEETAKVVGDWLKKQSPEIREWAENTLSALGDQVKELLQDGSKGLLEKAGLSEDPKDWGDSVIRILNAILESGGI